MVDDLRDLYCTELGLCDKTDVDLDWALDNCDRDKLSAMGQFYIANCGEAGRADYMLLLCLLLCVERALDRGDLSAGEEAITLDAIKLAMRIPMDAYYLYKVIDTKPYEDDRLGQWFMAHFPAWTDAPSPWN